MAAQPDKDTKSPPVYEGDQAMLRLLQQQHARHQPQRQPLPTSPNHSNHSHHSHHSNHSNAASTHRSPVAFEPADSQESLRRPAREVVPGLPRSQTLKRQQSERREHLTPAEMPLEERRAVSSDNKSSFSFATCSRDDAANSFATPSAYGSAFDNYSDLAFSTTSSPGLMDGHELFDNLVPTQPPQAVPPPVLKPGVTFIPGTELPDTTHMSREEFDALIQQELENVWILNLSMHFRDRSKREKFFVTYREREHIWRRVTISLDYRMAAPDSLEGELADMKFQRDKSAKIYEAIRDSLPDIQFYETCTNLKLQTSEGRLHVHVVEDGNEKIDYPRTELVKHLNCFMVKQSDVCFDSHMSGFVYKVRVNDEIFVKKEIPGSETVEEFLYEIHALHSLQDSNYVIRFRGLVTDDEGERVKALLIDYSSQGALIDRVYDECKNHYLGIPWRKRERWARQIIHGVSDIHESGFVQGDLTLANVVLDEHENARIIDVNRRGCPVGWEPPEARPLVDTNQRLSLYIGVKSDLFQLGMVLWALAMEEDEPEIQGRPLLLGPEVNIPDWYRQITEICLSHDPRSRLQAAQLLTMIPELPAADYSRVASRARAEQPNSPRELPGESVPAAAPATKGKKPFYPARGRSPPSPMPSDSSRQNKTGWAANIPVQASYDDMTAKAKSYLEGYLDASRHRNSMPTPEYDQLAGKSNLAPPKTGDSDRSFLDDASRASATPPASLANAVGALPKKLHSLDSVDSGIFMRSNSEETISRPDVSPKEALTQRIQKELLDDLERNGAAKSALQAILGLNPEKKEAAAALDDNASVAASFVSRTSSPDGDMEGGAQLGRSDTAFSAVDTYFTRPDYPAKAEPTTVLDTTNPLHSLPQPSGTLTGLGVGKGIAAPLLADLNPDIHFDSALWPDATRRFMTGAKS